MNQEVIIWAAIVAILATALIIKTISDLRKNKKVHIIEFGSEEDIFYCPGDIKYNTTNKRD